jgi:hypothetical protein
MDGGCPTLHVMIVRMKMVICCFSDENGTGVTGTLAPHVSTWTSKETRIMDPNLVLSPGKSSLNWSKNPSGNAKPAKIDSVTYGRSR